MKFSVRENKDSAKAYVDALTLAGYEQVQRPEDADFLLYDSENVGNRRAKTAELMKTRPAFVYPHTPLTCWLWDGVYEPLPAKCNFVAGPAQKQAMEIYGYPSPVEVCGFPRCEVLPFKPTTGRNLLFVPARPRRDNGRQAAFDLAAFKFVTKHRDCFENVIVCHVGQYDDVADEYRSISFARQDIRTDPEPARTMLAFVDWADLIISCNTPAALGVARGKPTVFYGENDTTPQTNTGREPQNYAKYVHLLRYPLTLEDLDIGTVLYICEAENAAVERWKRENIGGNFNPNKFIKAVKEWTL